MIRISRVFFLGSIFILFFAIQNESYAQIWLEDFALPDGTIDDPTPPSIWSRDITGANIVPPRDYFEVRSGAMAGRDLDGEVIWTSEQIDISAFTNVAISFLLRETGRMEAADYVRGYYKIDGGPEVLFAEQTDDISGGGPITLSVGSLNGSLLTVIIKVNNDGGNEIFVFDDVTVAVPAALYSINTGNWSDGNSWSYASGGTTCNCTPVQLSLVTIEGGNTINYDVTAEVIGLLVASASQLQWAGTGGALTIIGGGSIQVDNGGAVVANGNAAALISFISNGSSLIINDNINGVSIENLTFLGSNGSYSIQGTGSLTINDELAIGGNNISVTNNLLGSFNVANRIHFLANALNNTFTNNSVLNVTNDLRFNDDNCVFNNNGTLTLGDDIMVAGVADINNSFINNNSANVTLNQFRLGNAPGFIINNSGTFTMSDRFLRVASSNSINNLSNSIWNYGGTTFDADVNLSTSANDNIFNYTAGADAAIITPNDSYYHLGIDGSGIKSMEAPFAIDGNLSITSSLDMVSFDLSLVGDLINSGTFVAGFNTFTLAGSDQSIITAGSAFNNLIIGGTNTKSFQDNLDVNGNLIINATLLPVNSGFLASIGGNWTNNGTFTRNNETITFDGTANQNITGTSTSNFTNITINKSDGSLNVESTVNLYQTLDIQSATNLDADGSGSGVLTLISNTTEDSRIAALAVGASITGDLVIEKFFGGQGIKYWRHISSAVLDAPVSDLQQEIPISGTFTGNNNGTGGIPSNAYPSLYYYDNTSGLASETLDDRWVAYPSASNTELLSATGSEANGYAIWVRDTGAITFDLTGPVNQGTIDFNPTGNNEGWNLLGNPYPSDIDWDAASGWTKSNIQGNTIHIWNGTQYLTWNGTTGSLDNGYIAKGQGFWIKASAPSVGLSATEAVKTSFTASTYRVFDNEQPSVIELSVTASGYNDRTYIQFNDSSAFEFDVSDASKLKNSIFNLSTLSADSVELSINLLSGNNCSFDVPVHLTNTWNDSYSFAWTLSEVLLDVYQIKLEDYYTAEVYNINSGAIGFNFDIDDNPGSRSVERFVLHFETSPIDNFIISSSQNCDKLTNASITVSGGQFGVEYSLWQDGVQINSLNGTGEMLQFELDSTSLTTGINSFLVKAARLICSGQQLDFEVELNVLAQPVITYDADQNLLLNSTGQVGQWYNEEILITDSPANNITPSLLLGGAYSIIVGSENCQLQSSPFLITANEEIISSNSIDIYPNPATDYIELRLEELNGQEVSISITDINGRVHLIKEKAPISEKIDLKNIPQGIYVLILESKTRLYKSRFVKL